MNPRARILLLHPNKERLEAQSVELYKVKEDLRKVREELYKVKEEHTNLKVSYLYFMN